MWEEELGLDFEEIHLSDWSTHMQELERVIEIGKINHEEEAVVQTRTSAWTTKGKAPMKLTSDEPRKSTGRRTGLEDFLARTMLCCATNLKEPQSLYDSLCSNYGKLWEDAVKPKLTSIENINTFEVCELPEGKKAIGRKWVLKIKIGANGEIVKHNARLACKGFMQRERIDYGETYAPVVRFESLRAIIAIAAACEKHIHGIDVETTFLNGELEEEVYMQILKGVDGPVRMVWKLKKSLYGLKQAPWAWNNKLHLILTTTGFIRFGSDHGLYGKGQHDKNVIIGVYADDLLMIGDRDDCIQEVKDMLRSAFKMADMGPAEYILGIHIQRGSDGEIKLSQAQYARDVLERFNMLDCKTVNTPLSLG